MPEYSYVAQAPGGPLHRGRITADAPADAREMLQRRGQQLLSIREQDARSLTTVTTRRFRLPRPAMTSPADGELLLQQLAVMIGSGLELAPSLRELAVHSPRRHTQELCTTLADAVEQGNSFETALADSAAFPMVVRQLVRVGEATGELPTMLQRAAEFIQRRRLARGNLIAALAYPLVVALAACAVAAYLVGWAIPKLATFLYSLGRKLPAMTQSLVDLSTAVREYGPTTAIALTAAGIALLLTYLWKPGRYHLDRHLLRAPIIGPLARMTETQQLASSLALMLRSGIFLPEALHTAVALHRNQYLASQVARAREQLAMGKDLGSALGGFGFSPMLASMVAVGERTGELPRALEHVADFYAAQLETRIQRITKLIEPAIIVVVGGVVGYVYVAFFMALLSAGGKFN